MNTLRERIAEAMHDAGKSQAELARACEVKAASVSDWISGKTQTMKAATAMRAADFLGVNVLWLTEGRGQKSKSLPSPAPLGSKLIPVQVAQSDNPDSNQNIPADEQVILEAYRLADEPGRAALRWAADQCLSKSRSGRSILKNIMAADPASLMTTGQIPNTKEGAK